MANQILITLTARLKTLWTLYFGDLSRPLRVSIAGYVRSPLLKSVAQITVGNLVVSLISLVSGFLLARWIAPYDMGIWVTANLVMAYVPLLHLGVFSGLNRQLPYLIGEGRMDKAKDMAETSFAWSLVLIALSIVATVVWVGWSLRFAGPKFAFAALAVGVAISFLWISLYLQVTYRTHFEFGRLARNSTGVAVAGLVLLFLVWRFGYYGNLLRVSILAFLGFLALFVRRPLPVSPRWNTRGLISLAKIGIPITVLGQMGSFFSTMDRLSLASSTEAMGFFSLAVQAAVAARIVPIAFAGVVYPTMAKIYGETHSAMEIWRFARKPALGAVLIGGLVGICGWVAIPYIVERFLPNYTPGVNAARWAAFMGLAMGLSIFDNVYNVIRRQDIYVIGWVVGVAVFWGILWILTQNPTYDRKVAASQAMLGSTFVFSCLSVLLSWVACKIHDIRQARYANQSGR